MAMAEAKAAVKEIREKPHIDRIIERIKALGFRPKYVSRLGVAFMGSITGRINARDEESRDAQLDEQMSKWYWVVLERPVKPHLPNGRWMVAYTVPEQPGRMPNLQEWRNALAWAIGMDQLLKEDDVWDEDWITHKG